jgi:GGDEF domain-containing protein
VPAIFAWRGSISHFADFAAPPTDTLTSLAQTDPLTGRRNRAVLADNLTLLQALADRSERRT